MSIPISTTVFYEKNKHLFGSSLNWLSDDIKVVFLSSSHIPDSSAHEFYGDISVDAVSTPQSLDNTTASADGTTGEGVFDADNEDSIVVSDEWQYVVVYKDSGTPSSSPLLFYGDAESGQAAGTYNAVWSVDGVMRVV